MPLRHVTEVQQFDRLALEALFKSADRMQQAGRIWGADRLLKGKIMATLFYQPSTRTRMSFESAMLRLGGQVISTENAKEFSSAAKDESLEDSIRVAGGYADVIVLRHHETGAAGRAAAVSDVPVINAGDGSGQHPTQALLDLYTIRKELGRLDGISVAFIGDLANGRTVRSLAYLLAKFPVSRLSFIAPDACRMKDDIKQYLDRHGVGWQEKFFLHEVLGDVDVVYQTRIQKEVFEKEGRLHEYEQAFGRYIVGPSELGRMRPGAILMHPLPRVNEILPEVDADPRAAYFRQAKNGLYVRMALLWEILSPSGAAAHSDPSYDGAPDRDPPVNGC